MSLDELIYAGLMFFEAARGMKDRPIDAQPFVCAGGRAMPLRVAVLWASPVAVHPIRNVPEGNGQRTPGAVRGLVLAVVNVEVRHAITTAVLWTGSIAGLRDRTTNGEPQAPRVLAVTVLTFVRNVVLHDVLHTDFVVARPTIPMGAVFDTGVPGRVLVDSPSHQ